MTFYKNYPWSDGKSKKIKTYIKTKPTYPTDSKKLTAKKQRLLNGLLGTVTTISTQI